jgi:hypothetical protein
MVWTSLTTNSSVCHWRKPKARCRRSRRLVSHYLSLGVPRWSPHSQGKGNTSRWGIQCHWDIHIWNCNELYLEQGSPHPPCSQMVPSPRVALGGSQQQQSYMGSVCAALSGRCPLYKECMESIYGVICREYIRI